MESGFYFVVLFVFGLAFGSFLNVLAFRYSPGKGVFALKRISGRSYCPKCKTTLRWYELLPLISFVFLRGKCRTCKVKISWQYPVVELLSGLIFLFVGLQLPNYLITQLLWIVVFLLLLLMSIIDLRHYLIPDEVNILLFLFGIPAIILKMFISPFQQFFVGSYAILFGIPSTSSLLRFGFGGQAGNIISLALSHAFGFLIAGGFFWAVYALTRGKGMGFGDVKLAFALGFLFGWPDIFFAMVFAFLLGGAWSLFVLAFRGYGMKSRLPFGPFFALGVFWLVFFGEATIRWYFGFFRV